MSDSTRTWPFPQERGPSMAPTEQEARPSVIGDKGSGATAIRAIVQDAYGSTDVLRLAEIDKPDIAANEVLAQGACRRDGSRHLAQHDGPALPDAGHGLRPPRSEEPRTRTGCGRHGRRGRLRGDQVPDRRRGVRHQPRARSPSTRLPARTSSPTSRPGSASSRPRSSRSPRSPPSRACATPGASRQDRRC